ncbi:MAG: ABC transporter transmembrane domain-containing protein, partial [Planctomycetota bacterium]
MKKTRTKISSASLKAVFREIIWPRRGLVAVGLVLILVNRVAGMVLPASTKYLIDDVLVKKDSEMLYPILAGLVAATAIGALTSFAQTKLLAVEAQHMIAQLRTQVHGHVLRLPVRAFE